MLAPRARAPGPPAEPEGGTRTPPPGGGERPNPEAGADFALVITDLQTNQQGASVSSAKSLLRVSNVSPVSLSRLSLSERLTEFWIVSRVLKTKRFGAKVYVGPARSQAVTTDRPASGSAARAPPRTPPDRTTGCSAGSRAACCLCLDPRPGTSDVRVEDLVAARTPFQATRSCS